MDGDPLSILSVL